MTAPARTQHHRRIDDVRSSGRATELSGFPGSPIVERLDLDFRSSEESREPDLSPPISPDLTNDTRRNGE